MIKSTIAMMAISVLLDATASAQSASDWARCIGREGPIIDDIIKGCTAVIETSQDPPQQLATAFRQSRSRL
jgi:hypothetical protein